jgi:hypothetical protein
MDRRAFLSVSAGTIASGALAGCALNTSAKPRAVTAAAFHRARRVRRVDGAKLFFAEEMPDLIAEEARTLWASRRPS